MKHTLLALAFAAAALTGCSSTKPAPVVVQDGKAVVAPAKSDSCKKGSCATKACPKKK